MVLLHAVELGLCPCGGHRGHDGGMHTQADIHRAVARAHALLARVGVALIAVTQTIAAEEACRAARGEEA
jgi:hypothetical protein